VALAGDGAIHVHIAEQMREVEECLSWCGRRPIAWLLDAQPVDERWCLVHATHATGAELDQLAARRAVVGLCPITEASLGDGIFPAMHWRAQRGCFGVGSDSNIMTDAVVELRTLEYSQRLAERARNVLADGVNASTGRSLFDAALAGGTQVLQRARSAAGLVPGASLDLVTLAPGHAALLGRHEDEILDSWIFAAGREAIDCVWRAGERLVSGGRHRDRERLIERYARALHRLRA
jgi:formiminoglutamate deiminase